MDVRRAFSLNAADYNKVNIIQSRVARHIVAKLTDKPQRIIDIGCGRGGIYEALPYTPQHFVGIDFAEGMLALHPKGTNITLLQRDFNDPDALNGLELYAPQRIVSASALQWARDLDSVLKHIAALHIPVTLAIFTSGTFRTLYACADLPPLIRTHEETTMLLQRHFDVKLETLRYTLHFKNVREMFRYMKRSGVGASRNILDYKAMKRLMHIYPHDYLEYEIIVAHQC
jgi:malonyl-CoA O-methyltransferase